MPPTWLSVVRPLPMIVGGTLVLSLAPVSAAEGTRLIGTGPVQVGTAGAGVASPQNSSWLSLNPAALVQVSSRVDVSTDIINGRVEVAPRNSDPQVPFTNDADGTLDDSVVVLAPAVTWVKSGDGQAFAAGFYTLSGLAMELPHGRTALGAAGGYDTTSEQRVMAASAAYARTVADGLSVGLALNVIYCDYHSDSITLGFTETAGDNQLDRSLGAGFSLSLYQHWDQVSLGAIYTSRQWMQTLDKYRDLLAGPPDQPPVLQLGVAWRPLPWLEPMLDYRWIDWDSVAVFGEEIANRGLHWRDQHIVKLAMNAHVDEKLALRAGLSYGRSPITGGEAFANSLSPLVTEWHGTLGLGWQASPRCDLQIAYLHGFGNTVTDNGGDAGGFAEGSTISLAVDAVVLGLGWRY